VETAAEQEEIKEQEIKEQAAAIDRVGAELDKRFARITKGQWRNSGVSGQSPSSFEKIVHVGETFNRFVDCGL